MKKVITIQIESENIEELIKVQDMILNPIKKYNKMKDVTKEKYVWVDDSMR